MSSFLRHLRRSRFVAFAATGALGSTALALGAAPAGAYPQDPNECTYDHFMWKFGDPSDPLWTTNRKTWVEDGIAKLDDALDYDGTPLIQVTYTGSSPAPLEVFIEDEPDGPYGSSDCTGFWINGNSDFTGAKFYWHVARHEAFHNLGAEHGGARDSFDANAEPILGDGYNPPTMGTCLNDWTEYLPTNTLVQDDYAYATWLHSSLSNRQMHANIGFENGQSFWGTSGGSTTYKTSGGATGPAYIAWSSPGPGHYVYQTVRVHTGDDNETYRVVGNIHPPSGTNETFVNMKLFTRVLAHNGDNSCSYEDGVQNPNNPTVLNLFQEVAASSQVNIMGSGWQSLASGGSGWYNPTDADGYDFQVRAYGFTQNYCTSAYGPVYLDNVRAEGT